MTESVSSGMGDITRKSPTIGDVGTRGPCSKLTPDNRINGLGMHFVIACSGIRCEPF